MNGGGAHMCGMFSSKVQMAQRNYENTELTYLLCSQQISNKFPTHNLELKKGDKIFYHFGYLFKIEHMLNPIALPFYVQGKAL